MTIDEGVDLDVLGLVNLSVWQDSQSDLAVYAAWTVPNHHPVGALCVQNPGTPSHSALTSGGSAGVIIWSDGNELKSTKLCTELDETAERIRLYPVAGLLLD